MNRKVHRKEKVVVRRKSFNGVVLDVGAASLIYGSSERSFRGMIARGIIPYHKLQSRVVFLRSELDQWFETLPGVNIEQARENAAARSTTSPRLVTRGHYPQGSLQEVQGFHEFTLHPHH